MRGPVPLDDRDFAAIRAQVLAKVARPRRAPLAAWAAFAASVVVAVGSVFVARVPAVAPPRDAHPVVRGVAPAVTVARHTPAPVPPPRLAQGRAERRRKPATTVARIEIQTADPDVRIIWFTSQEEIQ